MRSLPGCFLFSFLAISFCSAQTGPGLKAGGGLEGDWKMLPEKSSEIGLYTTVGLHIEQTNGRVVVVQQWGGVRGFRDSLSLPLDGSVVRIPVTDRVWPTNVFMGVAMQPGTQREVQATSGGPGTLRITEKYPLRVSQGVVQVPVENQFTLSADNTTLTWRVVRPSRSAAAAPTYTFVRANIHAAYVMRMSDNWAIDGKLPEQAFLIKNLEQYIGGAPMG